MQQQEQYQKKRKYFWAYSIAVAALGLGAFWALAKPASEHVVNKDKAVQEATPSGDPGTLSPHAAESGTLPPGPVPGAGIVPGRKDDTDTASAPNP